MGEKIKVYIKPPDPKKPAPEKKNGELVAFFKGALSLAGLMLGLTELTYASGEPNGYGLLLIVGGVSAFTASFKIFDNFCKDNIEKY